MLIAQQSKETWAFLALRQPGATATSQRRLSRIGQKVKIVLNFFNVKKYKYANFPAEKLKKVIKKIKNIKKVVKHFLKIQKRPFSC